MFSPDNSLQMSVRLILDMLEEGVSLNTEEGVEEEEEKVDERTSSGGIRVRPPHMEQKSPRLEKVIPVD